MARFLCSTCVSVAALSLVSCGAQADHKHGHGDDHDETEHHHDEAEHHEEGHHENGQNHDHESDHDDANLGEQEAHVHGAWEMFAALDDARLSVTLKGPLVDALGFETLPSTDEERQAVASLKEKIESHVVLLTLDDRARCAVASPAAIVLPDGFTELAENSAESADHHDHDDHEDHENHDDHDHEDHDHAHNDIHSNNLEVTYVFDCASPNRLGGITIAGFETFPAMESVEAVFLGDVSQIVNQLDKKSPTLEIGM